MLRLLLVSPRLHRGSLGAIVLVGLGAATAAAAAASAVPTPAAVARNCFRSICCVVSFMRHGCDASMSSYKKLNDENESPSTVAEGTPSQPSSTVAYTDRKSVCHLRLP